MKASNKEERSRIQDCRCSLDKKLDTADEDEAEAEGEEEGRGRIAKEIHNSCKKIQHTNERRNGQKRRKRKGGMIWLL